MLHCVFHIFKCLFWKKYKMKETKWLDFAELNAHLKNICAWQLWDIELFLIVFKSYKAYKYIALKWNVTKYTCFRYTDDETKGSRTRWFEPPKSGMRIFTLFAWFQTFLLPTPFFTLSVHFLLIFSWIFICFKLLMTIHFHAWMNWHFKHCVQCLNWETSRGCLIDNQVAISSLKKR